MGECIQSSAVSTQVNESLKKALTVLHSNEYAHGDLRPQNILVVGDTVDFDWAGVQETARYSKELNMENAYDIKALDVEGLL